MAIEYDDALFRNQFPEFTDTTKYPAATLGIYFVIASDFIAVPNTPCGWMLSGATGPLVLNMMTAHILTLWKRNADSEAEGDVGGAQGGFLTSSSIGEISVARLAPPVDGAWQWWLSQTPYGQMIWALLELKSVGGTSVGGLPEREGFRKAGGVFW